MILIIIYQIQKKMGKVIFETERAKIDFKSNK
jgi:hypothetical protein